MTERMENCPQDACQVPPGLYVPLGLNSDGLFGPPSLEDWRLGVDRVPQEPLATFNSNAAAQNGQWALLDSSENVGMMNQVNYGDSWTGSGTGENWYPLGSFSRQPDANFNLMFRGLPEPAVSNYALPANMTYASPESGNTSSVVMANYAINSMPILDSSFTSATIRDNEIHRSSDPYSRLQDYPSFSASNPSYGEAVPWSGNPAAAYYPRPLGETLHQYGAVIFCPHAAPSGCLGGPSLEQEPRMLHCEWEGTCGVSITFDQASISRHIRTHIAEELAKAMSGVAGTTPDGKTKVRYLFDPTRSWLPSGITFDDLEVGARVRMVMEKGKVWARCLWGANGACAYCRTVGEKDKGELTLEYLPRHIWGIHFGNRLPGN
ncbi:hypothetical protein F5887DRAFT_971000 [Amanita rubescens]|nr:hypothetical protein F5887DRAFT_971000 [Amanita rubescens]